MFKPSVPQMPAQATRPAEMDPAVQAAAEAERRRQRMAAGQAATMLTGGSASTGPVGTTKLLGG